MTADLDPDDAGAFSPDPDSTNCFLLSDRSEPLPDPGKWLTESGEHPTRKSALSVSHLKRVDKDIQKRIDLLYLTEKPGLGLSATVDSSTHDPGMLSPILSVAGSPVSSPPSVLSPLASPSASSVKYLIDAIDPENSGSASASASASVSASVSASLSASYGREILSPSSVAPSTGFLRTDSSEPDSSSDVSSASPSTRSPDPGKKTKRALSSSLWSSDEDGNMTLPKFLSRFRMKSRDSKTSHASATLEKSLEKKKKKETKKPKAKKSDSKTMKVDADMKKNIESMAGFSKEIAAQKLIFGRELKKQRLENVKNPIRYGAATITVPAFAVRCVEFFREKIMRTKGIFRVSGDAAEIAMVRKTLILGKESLVKKGMLADASVCELFKVFWRELPEPLFPFSAFDPLLSAFRSGDFVELEKIAETCGDELQKSSRLFLMCFLIEASTYRAMNLMDLGNLAIVFAPNILRPKEESVDTIIKTTKDVIAIVLHLLERLAPLYFESNEEARARNGSILDKSTDDHLESTTSVSESVGASSASTSATVSSGTLPKNSDEILLMIKAVGSMEAQESALAESVVGQSAIDEEVKEEDFVPELAASAPPALSILSTPVTKPPAATTPGSVVTIEDEIVNDWNFWEEFCMDDEQRARLQSLHRHLSIHRKPPAKSEPDGPEETVLEAAFD